MSIPQFQIYGLYDPRNGNLRYIGRTTTTLACRLRNHRCEVTLKRSKNNYKSKWFGYLRKKGFEPEIRTIEICNSFDEMLVREQEIIQEHLSKGAKLTNTNFAIDSTDPTMRGSRRRNIYLGFVSPDGTPIIIENLSRFCRERGLSDKSMHEVYAGESAGHKGYTHVSYQPRLHKQRNGRFVNGLIRPDGTREPPFYSVIGFCRRTGLHLSRFRKLINGKIKAYKGWTYQEP
jgi:hypothetical protein